MQIFWGGVLRGDLLVICNKDTCLCRLQNGNKQYYIDHLSKKNKQYYIDRCQFFPIDHMIRPDNRFFNGNEEHKVASEQLFRNDIELVRMDELSRKEIKSCDLQKRNQGLIYQ